MRVSIRNVVARASRRGVLSTLLAAAPLAAQSAPSAGELVSVAPDSSRGCLSPATIIARPCVSHPARRHRRQILSQVQHSRGQTTSQNAERRLPKARCPLGVEVARGLRVDLISHSYDSSGSLIIGTRPRS
jgi:hypothetical protein